MISNPSGVTRDRHLKFLTTSWSVRILISRLFSAREFKIRQRTDVDRSLRLTRKKRPNLRNREFEKTISSNIIHKSAREINSCFDQTSKTITFNIMLEALKLAGNSSRLDLGQKYLIELPA
jgi:hypothetical protein